MPISVRLDPETQALLGKLARASGRTKSDVLREALRHLARSQSADAAERSPFEEISDLIGIGAGGPIGLARHHKAEYRQALARRRAR